MNRKKLLEAIDARFKGDANSERTATLHEGIRHLSDADLVVFAQNIGIDTDELLQGKPSHV